MNTDNDMFILHAARAFFACAWGDMAEENGHALRGEIMNQIPGDIDPAAVHAADMLLTAMLRANGCADAGEMLARCPDAGDRPHDLESLGHYAAMQAMGHGVGLGDAFGNHDCLTVPHVEFGSHSLEKEYL